MVKILISKLPFAGLKMISGQKYRCSTHFTKIFVSQETEVCISISNRCYNAPLHMLQDVCMCQLVCGLPKDTPVRGLFC